MSLRHRVLLADDDRQVRLGVEELLADFGAEIFHAEDGLQAIEVVRAQPIDAVLLDMHMPGCTGVEALPLLFEERADLRAIIYSGRWSVDLERAVLEAGAQACLKKPVEPEALRREIRRALSMPLDDPRIPGDLN